MKIAITGGTGFIGRHLARDLAGSGHQVSLMARGVDSRDAAVRTMPNITFTALNITDTDRLAQAFIGCAAIAHCAGSSREDNSQTYQQVHVQGARSLVAAARQAGVRKLVLISYLRARPGVSSRYLTTKWEGEEIVRQSGLDYTVLKAGLVYGPGDHLLDRLGRLLRVLPIFPTVGLREQTVRLIAVEDLVAIVRAALLEDRLSRQTLAVVGPEELLFSAAARRIAEAMGQRRLLVLPLPLFSQRLLAWASERFMPTPLVSASQIEMLADGISRSLPDSQALPKDLLPSTPFTEEQILKGLPG
jgi:NADH dehydrogenase